jgi:cyclopropane fatty-acyl-phospholipid synthase-like methyltransferase
MGRGKGEAMKLYKDWADVYDVIHEAQKRSDDIPFLLKLVKEYGGPVLECACGTGRVMIPLAKAGFDVHGIDSSREMLSVMEKKARAMPAAARSRLTFDRMDMRRFSLGRKFKTSIIAFNSLYHLENDSDMIKFFKCVNAHLVMGGIFIMDIFDLDPNYEQGVFVLQAEATDAAGRTIRKYAKTVFGKNQVNDNWFKFVIDDHGKRKTMTRKFRLHYLTHDQAWQMLSAAGFKVLKVYSNNEGESYRSGMNEKMIFVAKKVREVAQPRIRKV